jgi:hypothetical protein
MSQPLGLGMDEPADRHGAFPRLDEDQRARLRAAGEIRAVRPGEVLFGEWDAGYDSPSRPLGIAALAILALATGQLTLMAGIAASAAVIVAVAIADTVRAGDQAPSGEAA